jgi:signal transduction histidine kinase
VRQARLASIAIGVAFAAAAFLLELGLDEVVGPYPWFVTGFGAVVAASIVGGTKSGITAAGASWFLSGLVLPSIVGAAVFRPVLDALNLGLAAIFGSLVVARGAPPAPVPAVPLPRATRVLAGLTAAIEEFDAVRSPVQVADALARGIVAVTGARGAAVYLRSGRTPAMAIRARSGDVPPGIPERVDASAESTVGEAVRTGRWVSTDDEAALPIVVGRELSGVVLILGPGEGAEGSARAVLGSLVRLAGEALERDLLRLERQAARSEAADAAGRIASFDRLGSELAGAVSVQRVGELVVEHAASALRAEFGLIYVADPGDASWRLVHARGYPVGLAQREAQVTADGDGPVSLVARSRQPVEIDSPEAWRTSFARSSDLPAMTGIRSLIAIPLGDIERVDGILVLGWARSGAPTASDRDALATIAEQGGQALERARLHEQEREANRMQEAFISVISHELRTPITTIVAGSRLLRRRLREMPEAADLTIDIEAEADRLFRIVEDLLVLSRLERRNLSIADEPVHLTRLVDRVIASESRRWPATAFVGPVSGPVRVARGEETYIEQILRNLLSNAAKYSPSGATVRVELEDVEDEIRVRVLDEGPGIARSEVERLFTLFYRSPATAASAAGAGIGLFVSRRLADEMGGRMWAGSRPEGGSEFGFAVASFPVDDADDPFVGFDPQAVELHSVAGPSPTPGTARDNREGGTGGGVVARASTDRAARSRG